MQTFYEEVWDAALSAANERIRELELLLAAQKQEWSKAYDIGVTCKHHLAAEREVLLAEQALSDKLATCCQEFVDKVERGEARSKRSYSQMKAALAEVAAIRSNRHEV